ncbi:MAG: hypothetical protein II671_01750, partial [Salinivirgaceae bacterium]|nr:hypothetical protein [Salinivirgaceae bacterium]
NLPTWTESITSQDWYDPVSNLVKFIGITLDLKSVNGILKTVYSLCDKADDKNIFGKPVINLGIANELNGSALKNLSRSSGDLNVIYGLFQWLKDNIPVLQNIVKGNLSLGIVSRFVDLDDFSSMIKDLPILVRSALYKLINSDAEIGKFKKGEMGGDYVKSAYNGYSADQLLAAALLHLIKGDDSVISKDEANDVLALSVYGMIGAYAEPVFNKFLLAPINGALEGMNNWLADEGTNANLKTLFKASIPQIDTSTYKTIFDNAKTTGLLEQLNNILVAVLKTLLADDVYSALKLVNGNNSKLNANLTKIARYFVNFVKAHEDVAAELQIPADVLNADVSKLTLADMAFIALKPFFGTWFKDHTPEYSDEAVASADSNADLALLAVYYVATSEWLNLGKDGAFDFAPLKAKIFYKGKLRNLTNEKATDLIVETAADMGIGAMQYNADKIYFNETLDTTDWQGALNTIENWALNFVSGLPAVVKAHDLTNQNGYGPFYKLNVLLNELINFAFLNNANDGKSFTLDLEYLLKNALVGKVFDFDLAGIIGIFEQSKNKNEGNILNGQLNTTVIGMVDRIITALFEHSHNNTTKEYNRKPATGKNYCTKDTLTLYSYCDPCGAYTAAPEAQTVTTTATGKTISRHTK